MAGPFLFLFVAVVTRFAKRLKVVRVDEQIPLVFEGDKVIDDRRHLVDNAAAYTLFAEWIDVQLPSAQVFPNLPTIPRKDPQRTRNYNET